MATTTTIGLARDALVAQLNIGALAGNVSYAWPGVEASKGRHELLWVDRVLSWTQTIPNIKAGRKQRQESYTYELVLWVARPELNSDGAKATFERALTLLAVVENALANDVQLTETNLHWLMLEGRDVELVPYEKGWGCQILLRINGEARLS